MDRIRKISWMVFAVALAGMLFTGVAQAAIFTHTPPSNWPDSLSATNNPLADTGGTWTAFRHLRTDAQNAPMIVLSDVSSETVGLFWRDGSNYPRLRSATPSYQRFLTTLDAIWGAEHAHRCGFAGLAFTPDLPAGVWTANLTGTVKNLVAYRSYGGERKIYFELYKVSGGAATPLLSETLSWVNTVNPANPWYTDFDVTTPIASGDLLAIRIRTADYDVWSLAELANYTITIVPEPATIGLLVVGSLALLRRRK